jgi:hypothetical protein
MKTSAQFLKKGDKKEKKKDVRKQEEITLVTLSG